jgi:hypothetical protein
MVKQYKIKSSIKYMDIKTFFERNEIKNTKNIKIEKCIVCKNSIVKFGHARKNGKNHKDWNTRKLHKKCLKEYNNRRRSEYEFSEFLRKEKEEEEKIIKYIKFQTY